MADSPRSRTWDPLAPTDDTGQPTDWAEPAVIEVEAPTDLFHPAVETAALERMVATMAATPRHSYVLLTERAKRMLALGNEGLPFPRNLWVGVPVSTDDDVWRAEDLLRCNTPRSWVSAEPLRGPLPTLPVAMFSWIRCGIDPSEGGAAVDLDWVRDLRDRSVAAGVPFALRLRAADGGWTPGQLDGVVWDQRPPELAGEQART